MCGINFADCGVQFVCQSQRCVSEGASGLPRLILKA
jgi:hypothetical protein